MQYVPHSPWNAVTNGVRSTFCLQAPCSLCGHPTHVSQPNRFCTWCSARQRANLFAEEFSKPLLSSWRMDTMQRKGSVLSYHLQCPVKHILELSGKTFLLSSLLWVNLQQLKNFSLYFFTLELFKRQGPVPTIMHTYPDLMGLRMICSPQIETCPGKSQFPDNSWYRGWYWGILLLFVFQRKRRNEVKTTRNVRKLLKTFSQFWTCNSKPWRENTKSGIYFISKYVCLTLKHLIY